MVTESELSRTINKLQRSYDNAVRDNQAIDAKIDSLESALSWAKLAESRAESLERSIKTFKAPSSWVKGGRDAFDAALRGSLKTSTGAYENDVQSLREGIQREIRRLRLQKNHFVSLMQSIEGSINRTVKELRDLAS